MRSSWGSRGLVLAAALAAPGLAWGQDADGDGVSDAADAFPCDAGLSAVRFAPAEGAHGTLVFEDQWPAQGDLDFNDAVVSYHYEERGTASGALELRATYDVLALGGTFENGLGLHLPVPREAAASVRRRVDGGAWTDLSPSMADAELTVPVEPRLRSLFAGIEQINSRGDLAREPSVRIEVEVVFARPTALAGPAPYDVFLFRSFDPSHEIHRPGFAGTAAMDPARFGTVDDGSTPGRHFVDFTGLPFVLDLPAATPYPAEGVDIATLFPSITTFASSGGAQAADFYLTAASGAYADLNGQGAPSPAAPEARPADLSCVADPIPAYVSASRSSGCYWSFNPNASMNGARSFSMAGAGIPGSRWVRVDFGAPTAVSGFAANAYNGHYRQAGLQDFRIQYSDDAATWTEAFRARHPNASGTHVYTFGMQVARYWRFVIDSVYIRRSTSCGYGQFQGNFQFRNP